MFHAPLPTFETTFEIGTMTDDEMLAQIEARNREGMEAMIAANEF